MAKTVVVHAFKKYNILTDDFDFSKMKATPAAIDHFRCEIHPGTAETIDASMIDDLGRYKPPQRG